MHPKPHEQLDGSDHESGEVIIPRERITNDITVVNTMTNEESFDSRSTDDESRQQESVMDDEPDLETEAEMEATVDGSLQLSESDCSSQTPPTANPPRTAPRTGGTATTTTTCELTPRTTNVRPKIQIQLHSNKDDDRRRRDECDKPFKQQNLDECNEQKHEDEPLSHHWDGKIGGVGTFELNEDQRTSRTDESNSARFDSDESLRVDLIGDSSDAPPRGRKRRVSIEQVEPDYGYDQDDELDMRIRWGGVTASQRTEDTSTFFDEPLQRSQPRYDRRQAIAEDYNIKGHGKSFRRLMRNESARYFISRFPRTLAIFIGIIVPLWMLNLLSLAFGVWLAATEAPGEIRYNDGELAYEAQANSHSLKVTNITAAAPRLCAELFMQQDDLKTINVTAKVAEHLGQSAEEFVREDQLNVFSRLSQQQLSAMNWTEWYLYMADCGEAIRSYADELLAQTSATDRAAADVDLSFNWIRCHEDATGKFDAFLSDKLPISELDAQSQTETYKRFWEEDRQQLFEKYYEANLEANMSKTEAYEKANQDAIVEATGGDGCTLNGPGAAFFWFTVMTTIGYGNQAPDSSGGRALLYTLGFVSILAFGSILATAGTISSAVFDDFAMSKGLSVLTKPWCACIVWGSFYYGWMAFIAWAAQAWKNNRVEGSFSFRDGYWFAYLSTTTIGLGDVYLESYVIQGSDLLYLPIMMLCGFVFLAAFLGKFRELAVTLMKQKRATFVESLLMQMQTNEDDKPKTRMAGRMYVMNTNSNHRSDYA